MTILNEKREVKETTILQEDNKQVLPVEALKKEGNSWKQQIPEQAGTEFTKKGIHWTAKMGQESNESTEQQDLR